MIRNSIKNPQKKRWFVKRFGTSRRPWRDSTVRKSREGSCKGKKSSETGEKSILTITQITRKT